MSRVYGKACRIWPTIPCSVQQCPQYQPCHPCSAAKCHGHDHDSNPLRKPGWAFGPMLQKQPGPAIKLKKQLSFYLSFDNLKQEPRARNREPRTKIGKYIPLVLQLNKDSIGPILSLFNKLSISSVFFLTRIIMNTNHRRNNRALKTSSDFPRL